MNALFQSEEAITWSEIEEALSQSNKQDSLSTIEKEIRRHPSWLGRVSGLRAEKMLYENENKAPYLYVLRQGEGDMDYYVSFVRPDMTIQHQPFIINVTLEGWFVMNSAGRGPYIHTSIESIVPLIIHCEEPTLCRPLTAK